MYAVEERSHPVPPPPPPLSMDRIPPPSSAYPTPGSAGPMRSADHLAPVSTIHEGRIWSLQVVQQPIRARMCGFGDKVSKKFRMVHFYPREVSDCFIRIEDQSRLPPASA
jgi:hypothetical protein